MLTDFLSELFSIDPDFAELRINDIDESIRQAILALCDDSDLTPPLKEAIRPLSHKFGEVIKYIGDMAKVNQKTIDYSGWHAVAEKSEKLAETNPKAATIIAATAFAAWEGALGEMLFYQPWEGYHPGWHIFPLILARNAVKGGALWAPRRLLKTASEFIGAAKMAPFDEGIRSILAQYREVSAMIEKSYAEHVANLAWDLREASSATKLPNFRLEIAALLWTLGYVPQAHLMKADDGISAFRPSLHLMKFLVDQCMQTMSENSLMQYIWLEMKDRPTFNLRAHRELFALINVRFHTKLIHMVDELMPEPPSRSYAKVLVNYFRGIEEKDQSALQNISLHSELLVNIDPLATVQMRSLLNLVAVSDKQREKNWEYLSNLATHVLEAHNRIGELQNLGRCLDIPFYYLGVNSPEYFEEKEHIMEVYRCAGIWYWLMVTPPTRPIGDPEVTAILEEENILLRELRGARFIRLLPHLPRHYGRHGFRIDEAMDTKPPDGAEQKEGLLKFNPFDQNLAIRELKEAGERLFTLFDRMQAVIPEYAVVRSNPLISVDKFTALLNEHRKRNG